MNFWYIAAIILGAVGAYFGYNGNVVGGMNKFYFISILLWASSAFCAYFGSSKSADRQTEKIESGLKDVGNSIQELRGRLDSGASENEIDNIQQKYNEIAVQFFQTLPIKVQEEKARFEQTKLRQLELSRIIEKHSKVLEDEAVKLVNAFNSATDSKKIKLEIAKFPINVFENVSGQHYYILLSFGYGYHWAVRTTFQDTVPVLQIVRLWAPPEVTKYHELKLTDESINLLFVSSNEFEISLNSRMSPRVSEMVVADIQKVRKPMSEFDSVSKTLLQRAIEFELLAQSLEDKNGEA